jgi:membrane-associated phospholipid phosphatase/protein-S-isoprenylcysteine O-methyltransferase Ste14
MKRSMLGEILYGTLFVVLVPGLLGLWAAGTRDTVHLPVLQFKEYGLFLITFAVTGMIGGMSELWQTGGGLPMNAFPPPRFVATGMYGLVPHPIYGDFVLICAGVALYTGSASGLWLVTPSVAMGCAALVLGYELPDLRRRFGTRDGSVWLPREQPGSPSLIERIRIYPVILLPWLALYEGIGELEIHLHSMSTYLPFEKNLPVIEQAEPIYASTYLVVILAPLLIGSGTALRRFAKLGLRAMALMFPLYLVFPFFVPPRPFHAAAPMGWMLAWERTPISGTCAFPSYHLVWACIAASALGSGGRWKKALWWTWAVLVGASCIATGMHSILDMVAGAVAYLVIARMDRIWKWMLRGAERIANSWREWRIGPMRIINHGGYAAAATLVGMATIDTLLGPGHGAVTVIIYLSCTVGAALWAQWVEGSPALLRPLGFYGAVLGAVAGCGLAVAMGSNAWVVCAAIAVAAPWIQGIGRLRCLVQGCCHGRAVEALPGISYTHPRSRVCRLAHLAGVPVHATQVYSILCNAAIAAALLRLVQAEASCSTIIGIYLLLSSAGRFVEEAYRGEPQTKSLFGLHLYQWISIATGVAGAIVTTFRTIPLPAVGAVRVSSILIGVGCGAAAWFVTGIDFPESSRRFARLT